MCYDSNHVSFATNDLPLVGKSSAQQCNQALCDAVTERRANILHRAAARLPQMHNYRRPGGLMAYLTPEERVEARVDFEINAYFSDLVLPGARCR